MANQNVFRSIVGKLIPRADAKNSHGAPAYALSPKQALAQYAATGCFNATFYASADEQLDTLRSLAFEVDTEFVAKCAVYARERGLMKDTPAFLCAVLAVRSQTHLKTIFGRVINDPKMLRNFVQIMRSGAVGTKSMGTATKRLVQQWLANHSEEQLFRGSVGAQPSLADVVKMVHPKPKSEARAAFYGYLLGKEVAADRLPPLVRAFEAYKANRSGAVPEVPFQMLTALSLGKAEWTAIAASAGWQMTRMNLNTFQRHGVFEDPKMVNLVAQRLADPQLVRKSKAFPYQLMMAYLAADDAPGRIREALQDAMELAIDNVPTFEGRVVVCPDVSGSMGSPVTGHRKGATTKVRCIDVAALVTAALLRKNKDARVIPFEQQVVKLDLNARDSVMTNARKLAGVGGGGTNCSAPLALLNKERAKADVVIYVSDNESWVDAGAGRGTATMQQWEAFRANNPGAKLICIDLVPNRTSQAQGRAEVLNVGGFSDAVFEVARDFVQGGSQDHWVSVIEEVVL